MTVVNINKDNMLRKIDLKSEDSFALTLVEGSLSATSGGVVFCTCKVCCRTESCRIKSVKYMGG